MGAALSEGTIVPSFIPGGEQPKDPDPLRWDKISPEISHELIPKNDAKFEKAGSPFFLTWPMAKLQTFGDSIFSRENKVQTFFSGSIG